MRLKLVMYAFSVERIFSPYARNSGDLSTLTAADLPWPDVIDACIKTLLSWLHALSDGTVKNVYYFPQDLNDFKEPPLWTDALPETFILAEATSPRLGMEFSYTVLKHFVPRLLAQLAFLTPYDQVLNPAPRLGGKVIELGIYFVLLRRKLNEISCFSACC